MESTIYFNGAFVPESEAKISPMTHALNYGTGCFEGIRAYYSEEGDSLYIFRMKEHFERLQKSGKVLFMDIPHSINELCEITQKLVQRNFSQQDLYIRPLLYKADLAVGNFDLRSLKTGFLIYTVPLGRFTSDTNGIRVNTSSWTRVSDNSIPPRAKVTGAYINTALAKTESLLAGYDEALFMDKNGHIVEGSAENIFVVSDGKILTPPVSDDILQGITRSTVIQLCQAELKLEVIERSIARSEIYQADEVFLVGTGAEVLAIRESDGRNIGNGKTGAITAQIKQLYHDIIHGKNSIYADWLTKVTK